MKNLYLFNEVKEKSLQKLCGKRVTYISDAINLGLPVMNGFVITNNCCNQFYIEDEKLNKEILEQINDYINKLEQITEKKFGDVYNPLIISVKSSSKIDIPDIFDSILNVGLTSEIVEKLSKNQEEYMWIWECYLNFIKDYSKIVDGVELECYDYIKEIFKNNDLKLTIEELKNLSNKLKNEYKLKTKKDFPDDSKEQLFSIITAAFKSLNNKKANIYRKDLNISFEDGMSLCIQPMVFGNINKSCGVGTIFTRNPITGEVRDEFTNQKYFVGKFVTKSIEIDINTNETFFGEYEYLINKDSEFAILFPEIYNQLLNISKTLERHYKDMLKIDFVVENNNLFITDVSKGKRTVQANMKIQSDIFNEYYLDIDPEEFLTKREPVNFEFVFGGFKQPYLEKWKDKKRKNK